MRRLPLLAAFAVVAVVRWIVPRRHRARWLAEWRAELHHRWGQPDADVLARSLSALPHATSLARHEWAPDMLFQDVRYALRRLSRDLGFVVVAVLTIAIGVGANTAIFSVINSTLITPLPVPDADRLVYLWRMSANSEMIITARMQDLETWEREVTAFEEMQIYAAAPVVYTGGDEPEELITLRISADFFSFLGIAPQRGRGIGSDDTRDDAPVVIISDGFWRGRLGARDDVLNTSILLDGEAHDIVGVLPRSFVFQAPFRDTPVWLPLADNERDRMRAPFAMAKLKPGVSLEAANDELDALSASAAAEGDLALADFPGRANPPNAMIGENFVTAMLAMQVAVGFVLLIACANVANLLLARGTAQQREMAVRSAIGAGRGRLLRQLLTENLVLALAGGVVGYGFARASIAALMVLKPDSLSTLDTVRVDPSILAFALAVAALTGVIFGLVPALQGSRPDVLGHIKDATRSGTPSGRRVWLRNGLVVAQVALSIVLLVGAGLLLHSLGRLLATDVGFDVDNLLTLSVDLPDERYPDDVNRLQFNTDLEERIRGALGGRLDSIAYASGPPGRLGIWFGSFAAEGEEPQPTFDNTLIHHTAVSAGYFQTMRIPLLHGRPFGPADIDDDSNPTIVNAEWARRMWGTTEVVGERYVISGSGQSSTHSVVGVIQDAALGGQGPGAGDVQSFSPAAPAAGYMTMLIRTSGDPLAHVGEIKQQVWAIDPSIPVKDVALVEDLMSETLAPQRFNATLLSVAAIMAVCLALIGLYGVLAYSVGQRTREIGIRIALGAEAGNLVPMVAWQGIRLVLGGLLIGVMSALALTRMIESLLYEVTPSDGVTYLVVTVLIVAVSALACLLPATRAARLDPMTALRSE